MCRRCRRGGGRPPGHNPHAVTRSVEAGELHLRTDHHHPEDDELALLSRLVDEAEPFNEAEPRDVFSGVTYDTIPTIEEVKAEILGDTPSPIHFVVAHLIFGWAQDHDGEVAVAELIRGTELDKIRAGGVAATLTQAHLEAMTDEGAAEPAGPGRWRILTSTDEPTEPEEDRMSRTKEVKDLVKVLRDQGFEAELNGGGHWKITDPTIGKTYTMSGTPGDHRWLKSAIAGMKGLGFSFQYKGRRYGNPGQSPAEVKKREERAEREAAEATKRAAQPQPEPAADDTGADVGDVSAVVLAWIADHPKRTSVPDLTAAYPTLDPAEIDDWISRYVNEGLIVKAGTGIYRATVPAPAPAAETTPAPLTVTEAPVTPIRTEPTVPAPSAEGMDAAWRLLETFRPEGVRPTELPAVHAWVQLTAQHPQLAEWAAATVNLTTEHQEAA